jgi:hypothetical protein
MESVKKPSAAASTAVVLDRRFNLFENVPMAQGSPHVRQITIRPNANWKTQPGSPAVHTIDFQLPKFDSLLIDTASFNVHMRSRVIHENGAVPAKDTKFAVINAIGVTAFSYVSVQIGNEFICGENKHSVLATYLSYLLNSSAEAKRTLLRHAIVYAEDDAGHFDDVSLPTVPGGGGGAAAPAADGGAAAATINQAVNNSGFVHRNRVYEEGKIVYTVGRLDYPLSNLAKLLIPSAAVRISLKLNDSDFLLMYDPREVAPKLVFDVEDIYITCNAHVLEPEIMASITRALVQENQLARYHFQRPQLAGPFHIGTTSQKHSITAFRNNPPALCFVFMCEQAALQNNPRRNPLNFINPHYRSISMSVESNVYPLGVGFEFRPDAFNISANKAQCQEAYLELFRVMRQQFTGSNSGLTMEKFLEGFTVIPIALSSLLPSSDYSLPAMSGDTVLNFELEDNLPADCSLFVLGIVDSWIYLDVYSGVLKNYLK